MTDSLDIPEFLRIPHDQRRQAWKGIKLTKPSHEQRRPNANLPKEMSPEAWAMLREAEKAKAERKTARLQQLKSLNRHAGTSARQRAAPGSPASRRNRRSRG